MIDQWQFWIDVGGTFTDCVGRNPDGTLRTFKLLSSGIFQGAVGDGSSGDCIIDPQRRQDPPGFFAGYRLSLIDEKGSDAVEVLVTDFDSAPGVLRLAEPLTPPPRPGMRYQLRSGEEAPVIGIRWLLGKRRDEPIGAVRVRLGTTRATNALLERKGARTALVTTRGFRDVLRIGYQNRPRLFELHIRKPEDLYAAVIELDERLDAAGNVLRPLPENDVRTELAALRVHGIDSLAVCFLHSYRNDAHERLVGNLAREAGFQQISLSSQLSPLPKIVPRGETAVLDAYLTPVIRSYVENISRALPDASLRLMTSAGGLVKPEAFAGKDAILSGPAGGVVGAVEVARQAGFNKIIGFDMGGTSTDVSRFDREYERRYEMELADPQTGGAVRVVAPMLAVETVAAGGGSICWFDGQKPRVGPHSAGAAPGPACYGRGGPLCVTDVNYFLGRLVPDQFPFPLDHAAVTRRLDELIGKIAAATGQRYGREELASGLVTIANANMAAAIKRISIARGYDAREYTLVSFGGAGGQHACAVADELGINTILCSAYAGVLSAVGIGVAHVTRFAGRAIGRAYEEVFADDGRELERQFVALEDQLREEMRDEGVAAQQLEPPRRLLDLRYAGQDARLTVPCPPDENYRREFERLHRQLYGFIFPGRAIEVYAARVELAGVSEPVALAPVAALDAGSRTPGEARAHFAGAWRSTVLLLRSQLQPGNRFSGPAIIAETTATVVVEPGWEAEVTPKNEIVLSRQQPSRARQQAVPQPNPVSATASPDPIELELFNNQFASIAEQMGAMLQKTALSTNVKERLDFSCAIFSATGDLVVNAPHIPVHLGAMSECVKCLREDVPTMKPGEVYVTNDPYRGGTHLPDVTVITPVFLEGSDGASNVASGVAPDVEGGHPAARNPASSARAPQDDPGPFRRAGRPGSTAGETPAATALPAIPAFFVASRAHHAEIGGITPGSMPPFSRCLAEEGVLIRRFRLNPGDPASEAALHQLLGSGPYPSRAVEDNLADIHAQTAANQAGVRLLHDLVAQHGAAKVQTYMTHIQRAAENMMRAALRKIPAGEYRFTDHLEDGSPIAVRITIQHGNETAETSARVDFTGTGPVLAGNLNANRAIVTSALIYCFRCLIAEPIPLNAGVLAPITLVLPENCLLNPPADPDPTRCAAMVGGNVETSQRIVDVIFGALEVVAASQGTMNNFLFGRSPTEAGGKAFGYYETIGGGAGAGPGFHGADAVHTHMTNTRLTDPEVLESRYPVRLWHCAIRANSGGNGRHHGGSGILRELEFLEPLEVSLLTSRRQSAPYGLQSGECGAPGKNWFKPKDDAEFQALPPSAHFHVQSGDRLRIETPGGGGYGRV